MSSPGTVISSFLILLGAATLFSCEGKISHIEECDETYERCDTCFDGQELLHCRMQADSCALLSEKDDIIECCLSVAMHCEDE